MIRARRRQIRDSKSVFQSRSRRRDWLDYNPGMVNRTFENRTQSKSIRGSVDCGEGRNTSSPKNACGGGYCNPGLN